MKKRLLILLFTCFYMIQSTTLTYGVTDRDILSDPVDKAYAASTLGETITSNMNFQDVATDHWAKNPITKLGALSIVKGYRDGTTLNYRPNGNVSKQEALAFVLRVVGQEGAANLAAETIVANQGDTLLTMWSRGYLQIAANNGLITAAELVDGLTLDQTTLDPALNFIKTEGVTREQVAKWLVQAINITNPGSIAPIYVNDKIFTVGDWKSIGLEYVPYVEAVMQKDIMVGNGSNFKPKGKLTRAEMAQIIDNIDELLYQTMNLKLKAGIVGSISDSGVIGSLENETKRTILIRNDQGLVDQVELIYTSNEKNKIASKDVPVLGRDGVKGLASLTEGDTIVYVVDDTNLLMKYAYVKGSKEAVLVKGSLQAMTGFDTGLITIKNSAGIPLTYKLAAGLYDVTNQKLKINEVFYPVTSAPVTNTVTLTLINNLVTKIETTGATPLANEISGIVKEINTKFSFITIDNWDGKEITKYFNPNQVVVEKQNYYDNEDEIGYIDEVFPGYKFDERDTTINAIDVGDIVHMLLNSTNTNYVSRISAKTNYNVKFGEVLAISDFGAKGLTVRVSYSDGTIGNLTVASDVPVMRFIQNIGTSGLEVGNVVKILLNQAVLAPGSTIETVKQIDVDPYGNIVSKIYKGDFGYMNMPKKSISLLNSYQLAKTGWSNYNQTTSLELPNEGVEAFYKGKQISLSYADQYLKTSTMKMYVVTEKYYDREQVKKIIFEDGRGDVLANSNISYSNGYNLIRTVSSATDIAVDPGTIVIKNNHIVSTGSILSPDYAQIVLGSAGGAVIVNVVPEPNNSAISIFRGRIDSIKTGESVKVESHAVLKDMTWVYAPIQRQFTLSYTTSIVTSEGAQLLSEFIDYSELSKVDEVYTIIAEGTKALYLVKNPYATEGVRGEIYNISDDGMISIKKALVYDSPTKIWQELSYTNNYATIETLTETVIIKNNKVVTLNDLEIGDQVRAMITVNLSEQLKLTGNRQATGYILIVEK